MAIGPGGSATINLVANVPRPQASSSATINISTGTASARVSASAPTSQAKPRNPKAPPVLFLPPWDSAKLWMCVHVMLLWNLYISVRCSMEHFLSATINLRCNIEHVVFQCWLRIDPVMIIISEMCLWLLIAYCQDPYWFLNMTWLLHSN